MRLLSNHYDVLPTVFLTDKQLKLLDADDPIIYQQENWPWILTNMMTGDRVMSNRMREWIIKNNSLDILNLIELEKFDIQHLFLLAHEYSRFDIIEKYKSNPSIDPHTRYQAKIYTAQAGNSELLFDLLKNVNTHEMPNIYATLFQNGHLSIINDPRLQSIAHFNQQNAIYSCIEGGQLEILIDLLSKYEFTRDTSLEWCYDITPKSFHTTTYMLDHGYLRLDRSNLDDFVVRLISNFGPLELLTWIINKYGTIELNDGMVQESLSGNRLDYIKVILGNQEMTDDDVVGVIFEMFEIEIIDDIYDDRISTENYEPIIFNRQMLLEYGYRNLIYTVNKYLDAN